MARALRRYEFSERLAEILGESRRDLRFRVTLLVTGGIVPPGPRGPGSPPATADYAADLLIGVMAAPQQVHTVEAVKCYRALTPTVWAPGGMASGLALGAPKGRRMAPIPADPGLLAGKPSFSAALARLIDLGRDDEGAEALARDVLGVWVSRAFPVAAVQLAAWIDGRRAVATQRFDLPPGGRPPSWLDPEQGGLADPGLLHSVFLPVRKLITIAALTEPQEERTLTMPGLGQTIQHLSHLTRHRRHRRPWDKFLANAGEALSAAKAAEARPSRLTEVMDFGANPGNLRMMTYIPDDLPADAPLVVVVHGCTQTAHSYDDGTGWSTLADRHAFAVLYPQQRRINNPLRCFNWFRAEDTGRIGGEAESIAAMVERMCADHPIDRRRVFVTGLSAGGAMTSVMLAAYPDLFAGGAIIAGTPFGAASGLQQGFEVIFQGRSLSGSEWGDKVRAAASHTGPWPRVQVWHGDADSTVTPLNAEEIAKQWADVHSLSHAHTAEDTIDGHRRRVWRDAEGVDRIESITVSGMPHGQPIETTGPDGSGKKAPFFHEVGIASPYHIARSWGLTETRREVAEKPAVDEGSEAEILRPDAPAAGDEPITVDSQEVARWEGQPSDGDDREQARPRQEEASSAGLGIDIEGILAKSFELAGLLRTGDSSGAGESSRGSGLGGGFGTVAGVDIPEILATSFEAAGLLKRRRSRDPQRRATVAGIDIAGIISKSFEAAGMMAPEGNTDTGGDASETPSENRETADESAVPVMDGWELIAGAADASDDGPVLHGSATSGGNREVGNTVKAVSCRMDLGAQPRISYSRRLDLKASTNMATTAAFRVLVDGDVVDEVTAVGMDYTEDTWTERRGIDLSAYAGTTVTLTFEATASANVYVETHAKAWVRDICLDDATASDSVKEPAAAPAG